MTPSPGSGVLLLLIVATAALLALALLFGAATLGLRARNALRDARWARFEKAWMPPILDVLSGDRAPEAVAGLVAPADRLYFADFLSRFARRLKGPEQQAVRSLAAPILSAIARRAVHAPPERRARAVQTVGDLGGEEHTWALLAGLDDSVPLVVMTAVRALARRGRPEHMDAVIARLKRFDAWSYGFLASTLAAFGPPAAPQLRWTLGDRRQRAPSRIVAAEALRMLNDLEAAETAAAVVRSATDTDLLAASLRLLAAVGTSAQAPAVRGACKSPDPAVRGQAFAALTSLGGREDLDRLLEALDDPSPWVVLRAAEALKALDPARARHAASEHPAESVARLALEE